MEQMSFVQVSGKRANELAVAIIKRVYRERTARLIESYNFAHTYNPGWLARTVFRLKPEKPSSTFDLDKLDMEDFPKNLPEVLVIRYNMNLLKGAHDSWGRENLVAALRINRLAKEAYSNGGTVLLSDRDLELLQMG